MRNMLASIIRNKIVSCVVLLALGILLLVAPGATLARSVRLIGLVLLAGAIVGFLIYFLTKSTERSALVLIESGAVAVIAVVFLIAPGFITGFLPYVFGVILLLNALLDLLTALRLPSGKGAAVLLSLLAIAAAVLILCNPNGLANLITRIIGAVLIYNAVVGLLGLVMSRKAPTSGSSLLIDKK